MKGAFVMLVRECLRKAPVTVPPECTLEEAAGLMATHAVGSLLVVSGGELLGIVTDRDIVVRAVSTGQSLRSHVSGVMSETATVIQGSADIFDAFKLLKDAGVRRLPVLEDDDIAGILTVDDLLIFLVVELGAVLSPVVGEIVRSKNVD
jgi:CBS domain-containing protein